jgi:hypothetical protein
MPSDADYYRVLRGCVLECLESSDADGAAIAFHDRLVEEHGWPHSEAIGLTDRALSLVARIRRAFGRPTHC